MRRKHGEKTKKKQGWTQGGANLGGKQRLYEMKHGRARL